MRFDLDIMLYEIETSKCFILLREGQLSTDHLFYVLLKNT